MWFLLLSILCSSTIFILFKIFDKYQIHTLQAIVINYFTAFSIGLITHENSIELLEIPHKKWFIGATILAILFIIVFNLMALTSQKNGVSIAAVSSKMALIIPAIFGIILYQEKITLTKVIGITLGLVSVYLITSKKNKSKGSIIFPISVFFGAGIIDTLLKYLQVNFIEKNEINLFSGIIFGIAGTLGTIVYLVKPTKIKIKNIISGIILGVINYYSIYYILKALENKNMQSGIVFSLNNISIVVICTFLGLIIFKENLTIKNWIGIGISLISILFITQ